MNQIEFLKIENNILKTFGDYRNKTNKEKTIIVENLKTSFKINNILEVLNLKRSTYYKCKKQKTDKDIYIKNLILGEFLKSNKTYGYRRITYSLNNMGLKINHKKVYRLMKTLQIKSIYQKKQNHYITCYKVRNYNTQNLLQGNFYAEKPYQKWVTDITEFSICGRKIYFSPIIDLFNQEIISYSIFKTPSITPVLNMIDSACGKIHLNNNLILHTDNGWQYKNNLFKNKINEYQLKHSVSRPGKCHDNAIAENIFGIIKKEFVFSNKFTSFQEFRKSFEEYIFYYNNIRIKNKFKTSPVKHKAHFELNNAYNF